MTIHHLKEPCWVLDPEPPGEDWHRHYDTRTEARSALKEALDEGFTNPKAAPKQLDAPCWLIRCDGDCEQHIDKEGEGFISHCGSRTLAEEMMAAYQWAYHGDLVFCEADAPENAELPPPTPAELEAAGQLRLPGVA